MNHTRPTTWLTQPLLVASLVTIMLAHTPASAGPDNFCIAKDGVILRQAGTADCAADPGSKARAVGDDARAYAYGTNNQAFAKGTNSRAETRAGTNNKARAVGDGAEAYARFGDGNKAQAHGENALAQAGQGMGNQSTAKGSNAFAMIYAGNWNQTHAKGNNAMAIAIFGDNDTAKARRDGYAWAGGYYDNGIQAIVEVNDSTVKAGRGECVIADASQGHVSCGELPE